jgi:molybdopterin converting factor small subunit
MGQVTVEFYGMPRQRAGRAELAAAADTAAAALARVAEACPGLRPLLTPDGRLDPRYLLSIDGERFVADLSEPLPAGSRLLLLSADAGG